MRALKEFKKLNGTSFMTNRREHKNSGDTVFSMLNTGGSRYKVYGNYQTERLINRICKKEGHAFSANIDKDWFTANEYNYRRKR